MSDKNNLEDLEIVEKKLNNTASILKYSAFGTFFLSSAGFFCMAYGLSKNLDALTLSGLATLTFFGGASSGISFGGLHTANLLEKTRNQIRLKKFEKRLSEETKILENIESTDKINASNEEME